MSYRSVTVTCMSQRIRWGIAGPGRMAALMAEAFPQVANGVLVAVGSRDPHRAEDFAAAHGIPRAHPSYDALVTDPDVDAVYIATPHPQHTDVALAAIDAGKAILVEKAFTATVADTARIIEAAQARGTFAMEGMWTRFNPGVAKIREVLARGDIGQLRAVHGDLTAFRRFDPTDRLFDPGQGGGAVLDLGVYVISFTQHLLGVPDIVHAVGGHFPNGVESEFALLFGYEDGRTATLSGSFTTYGPGRMMLLGTQGWIEVHARFHRTPGITIWRGAEPEQLRFDAGYHYEVIHAGECIAAGRTESDIMPLGDTLAVQELMATALAQLHRNRSTTPDPPEPHVPAGGRRPGRGS